MPGRNRTQPSKVPCSTIETANDGRIDSLLPNISACRGIGLCIQRLRHDAHVGDAGLLHGVHNGGKGAEGHILIGADEDALALRIANLVVQPVGNFVDVDGIVAQKYALVLINGDDQPLLGDFLHSLRLGNLNLNPRLKDGRGDHEHHEQHQHNVHKGSDVDVGERGLGASLVVCKRHRYLLSRVAVAIDDVEQLEAEIVHAGGKFTNLLEEHVVGHHGSKLLQARSLAEDTDETPALYRGAAKEADLGENDRPG